MKDKNIKKGDFLLKKKVLKSIFKWLFILSQAYWVYWIFVTIRNYFNGMEVGWLIPSLSSHKMIYGIETIGETMAMATIVTIFTPFALVPLYQVVFVLVVVIKKMLTK